MKKDNAIICLSGGLDSAAALAKYAESVKVCTFIHYGSRQNDREERASRELARHYGKQWVRIDAQNVFRDFDSALLANSSRELPVGRYDNIEVCSAKVPFRNGIFISMLVGLAESFGLEDVIVGVHSGDHRLYPDCTPKFISAFNEAIAAYSGDEPGIAIFAPFLNKTKKEIADIAKECGLPIEKTYSCYNGDDEHCGVCPTCIERQEAIGEDDPTIYTSRAILSWQDCYDVFEDRRGIYGDNSFKQHSEKLREFLGAITIVGSDEIDAFFVAMLAHKAHRFYQGQNRKDSAIDFVNYLYLAQECGAGKRIVFSTSEEGRKIYANGALYNDYLRDDADFEDVIAAINRKGKL